MEANYRSNISDSDGDRYNVDETVNHNIRLQGSGNYNLSPTKIKPGRGRQHILSTDGGDSPTKHQESLNSAYTRSFKKARIQTMHNTPAGDDEYDAVQGHYDDEYNQQNKTQPPQDNFHSGGMSDAAQDFFGTIRAQKYLAEQQKRETKQPLNDLTNNISSKYQSNLKERPERPDRTDRLNRPEINISRGSNRMTSIEIPSRIQPVSLIDKSPMNRDRKKPQFESVNVHSEPQSLTIQQNSYQQNNQGLQLK